MMNLDRELLFRFFNKETTLEEEKKIRLWIDECDEHRREFFRERQEARYGGGDGKGGFRCC